MAPNSITACEGHVGGVLTVNFMWISSGLPPSKENNELSQFGDFLDALGFVMLNVDGDCGWTPLRPQWVPCFRKDSRGIQLGLRKAHSEIRLLASFRKVCSAICVLVSRPLAVGLACWCVEMHGLEEEGG